MIIRTTLNNYYQTAIPKRVREILDVQIASYVEWNLDEENKTVSFDLIIDFKAESKEKVKDEVVKEIKEKYPEYNYYVILDTDFSD